MSSVNPAFKKAVVDHLLEYLNGTSGRVNLWKVEVSEFSINEFDLAKCEVAAEADVEERVITLKFEEDLKHVDLEDLKFLAVGEVDCAVGSAYLTKLLTEAEDEIHPGSHVFAS